MKLSFSNRKSLSQSKINIKVNIVLALVIKSLPNLCQTQLIMQKTHITAGDPNKNIISGSSNACIINMLNKTITSYAL